MGSEDGRNFYEYEVVYEKTREYPAKRWQARIMCRALNEELRGNSERRKKANREEYRASVDKHARRERERRKKAKR